MMTYKKPPRYYGIWSMGLLETHAFITIANLKMDAACETIRFLNNSKLFK